MNYLIATRPVVDGLFVVERGLVTGSEPVPGDEAFIAVVVAESERVVRGVIKSIEPQTAEYLVRLEQLQELPIPAPLACTLVVGACRPQSLKKSLHHAATLGVKQVYVVGTERGESSYLSATLLSEEGITRELLLAAAQSGDPVLPRVTIVEKLWNLPCAELPSQRVLFDTCATHTVAGQGLLEPLTIAIGAEAGWSSSEISYFERQGFRTARFGERILRVEVAVAAALGAVLATRA